MTAAVEYVYKVVGDSPSPTLSHTTTYSDVYADNAILLATIVRATDTGAGSPTILPFNGNQATISAGAISAGAMLADRIKAKTYNVRAYFGDPAGHQAQGQSGLGDISIFMKKGIHVRTIRDKVSRSIASGVSHVRGCIENANGNRYLHLDNRCV